MQFQTYAILKEQTNEIVKFLKHTPKFSMWKLKCHETKVAEEYCCAIPQVRSGHTAADQVPFCLRWGFNWPPFYIHMYFTIGGLKYNLGKI